MLDKNELTVLEQRQAELWESVRQDQPGLDTLLIQSKINQYYLTGTMQDGLLVLRHKEPARLFVRKSYSRAKLESPLAQIQPMRSYRDMLEFLPADLGLTGLEEEVMSWASLERLKKYFTCNFIPVGSYLTRQRAVKDKSELAKISKSGQLHARLLQEIVPALLYTGMSETELLGKIYAAMLELGHHGVSRFAMDQMELIAGQLGFAENSLYPTNFDGPGGMRGMSPAVPIIGDRNSLLQKGDLVFVDVAFGLDGYHSDKTQIYSYGAPASAEAAQVHSACRAVLDKIKQMLKPGARPDRIYEAIMAALPAELGQYFMGYADGPVRFLGHGVGLQVDEAPVLARGNQLPLRAGMVVAVEPKCAVPGQGLVGVEETYLITEQGASCLTGGDCDIIQVAEKCSAQLKR